ncbi:MAG: hypothetical protein JWM80_272 [Cyanobacteria bacterium RYN_339]|nr:hypothetical protein [Cyanobacteria bacterium RYN_339]
MQVQAVTQRPRLPNAPPAPAAGAPLSAEEAKLIGMRLLPANYAQIKANPALATAGQVGPFSPGASDPAKMLEGARAIAANPELVRLCRDLRKGDVVVLSINDPNDPVVKATGGPYDHTLICTSEGPPPAFIEAIGITGIQGDPSVDRVRRSTLADYGWAKATFRRMSPAANLPPAERERAIAAAIRYCEQQLGKPYDYSFGWAKPGSAYYCSSLAYEAYQVGAGLPWKLSKSAERDSVIRALDTMMDALEPDDRARLMSDASHLLTQWPRPTTEELVTFVVERVLPACGATRDIATTPEARKQLAVVLARLTSGEGLPMYEGAMRAARQADQASGLFGLVGLAFSWSCHAVAGGALVADLFADFLGAGADPLEATGALAKLAWAFLPFAEAVSAFVYGKDAGMTKAAGGVLDTTGWLKDNVPWVFGWLPSRGTTEISQRFVSPTDLAWADAPYQDYNVTPGAK